METDSGEERGEGERPRRSPGRGSQGDRGHRRRVPDAHHADGHGHDQSEGRRDLAAGGPRPGRAGGRGRRGRPAGGRHDEPGAPPRPPVSGPGAAHGDQPVSDLLPVLHTQAPGGETRISQEGGVGPRHRVPDRSHRGAGRDPFGRRSATVARPSAGTHSQGFANDPASGNHPHRLARPGHLA